MGVPRLKCRVYLWNNDEVSQHLVFLERLMVEYHQPKFLFSDPLEFPKSFTSPWDQEAVAIVSALLAYGNVKQIRRAIADLLERGMGFSASGSFSEFIRSFQEIHSRRRLKGALKGFVHRFHDEEDIYVLCHLISKSWALHGSVGAHFLKYFSSADAHFGMALDAMMDDWKEWAKSDLSDGVIRPSLAHFLSSPRGGSSCKRWCMLFRWLVRHDDLDLGLWSTSKTGIELRKTFPRRKSIRPRHLILPLDTHTGRISQYLGLTDRKVLGWKAAEEITRALAECDSEDPTKYDFAISRLGILDLCQKQFRKDVCTQCQLLRVCRYAAGKY